MNTTKLTYGFRLFDSTFCGSPCLKIILLAREDDAEHPINCTEIEQSYRGAPKRVAGLTYNGLESKLYRGDSYVHRGDWRFNEAYSVEPEQARAMVKTFDRLAAAMKAAEYPDDIGDWIDVSAKTLGATWWVLDVGNPRAQRYQDSEWRWRSIPELKTELRRRQRTLDDELAVIKGEKIAA